MYRAAHFASNYGMSVVAYLAYEQEETMERINMKSAEKPEGLDADDVKKF